MFLFVQLRKHEKFANLLRYSKVLSFLVVLMLMFSLPAPAESSSPKVDPILTRPATMADSFSVISNARYFRNVKLQEADRFTGYGFDVEVAVPFRESMQFRLVLPAYTRGKARLLKPRTLETITIKGPAGTFDYPTILFDHQISDIDQTGYNLSYFIGYGKTIRDWGKLDTTHGDTYNHQGDLLRFGLHADGLVRNTNVRWLANAGLRAYIGSDDLNPAETGDDFFLIDLMTAAVFEPWKGSFHPAIELVYQGDIDRYHAVHLIPQVIVPLNSSIDLKAGTSINLTRDGESFGARLQMSYRR